MVKDINKTFLTLHMGIGHFREVDVEDLSKHKMDSERLIITEEAAEVINKTKREGHKVLAVGITVIRGLETYVTTNDEVNPYDGWTNKFIFPPYRFAIPNAIVSNFHRPGSTMLMSVAAFGGYENVMKAYKTALVWNTMLFLSSRKKRKREAVWIDKDTCGKCGDLLSGYFGLDAETHGLHF